MRLLEKSPAPRRGFCSSLAQHYRLRPEPGPVGVNVDPLGEPEGASVFPEGFVVVLGPERLPPAIPVVEPGGFAIEFPFTDEPAPVAAEPPTLEPAPDVPVPPLLCASAKVLESASAPANAIVMSFIVVSLVDDQEETSTGYRCSCAPNTKTSESPFQRALFPERGKNAHLPQVGIDVGVIGAKHRHLDGRTNGHVTMAAHQDHRLVTERLRQ
jgi:hypothetical protein